MDIKHENRTKTDINEGIKAFLGGSTLNKIVAIAKLKAQNAQDYDQAVHSFLEGFLEATEMYNDAMREHNENQS
jgi:hypothetical protein